MFILTLSLILLGVYSSINVVKLIIHNHRAQKYFQTKSPKLPVVSNPSIFIGNTFQVTWNVKNCETVEAWHRKLGQTFGFYIIDEPWVSTKDLDLIKRIEIDEAHKHLDRIRIGFPIAEFDKSIFQINGHEWHRVRRAIAPTLT